ncbi:MAG: type I-C CRISPR-associated protein Cas5c [Sphaerochaetaceae bacterium]|nr:type I-C CRISPR-associated protein Cas5c [Sphaerochaetaceae bacterium]
MKDWCLEVSGEYACFSRPEMKVERVSYDVMTPSSARAIFEAIFWKPAIKWHITQIEVLNPIRFISVRRNEVDRIAGKPTRAQLDGAVTAPAGFFVEEHRQQRAGLLLRDVRYRIHGWFEYIPPENRNDNTAADDRYWANREEADTSRRTDESPAKYAAMFERRARRGQCFHRPYFGCREFACHFRLLDPDMIAQEPLPIDESKDLGWMLYDLDFSDPQDIKPEFFRAYLDNGRVDVDRRNVEVRS